MSRLSNMTLPSRKVQVVIAAALAVLIGTAVGATVWLLGCSLLYALAALCGATGATLALAGIWFASTVPLSPDQSGTK